MKHFLTVTALILTTATSSFAHEAPTEHKGVSVFGRDALELGAQIPAMEGFQLRIRQVKLAPGGVVARHDHTTRPGAYFVIKGEGVIDVQGEVETPVPVGTAIMESQGVDHWVKNTGKEAHFFVLDIVPVDQ